MPLGSLIPISKLWKSHVLSVLGDQKSLIELVLDIQRGNKKQRRLSGINLGNINDDRSLLLAWLTTELFNLANNKDKKEFVMKDFDTVKKLDDMIKVLGDLAKKDPDYAPIMDSKKHAGGGGLAVREQELLKLGIVLCESAKYCHTSLCEQYIKSGFPMDFQHPQSGMTALQYAMTRNSHEFAWEIVNTAQYDYLQRDNGGRLTYDVAFNNCTDRELSSRIQEKTIEAAIAQGLDINNLFVHQKSGYWDKPSPDDGF